MITELIIYIEQLLWSGILPVILLSMGLYYTIRLRFLPWRRLPHSIKMLFPKKGVSDNAVDNKKNISSFQALMTALSSTVGTGNITGVAAAIGIGGPGALFWMWVMAALGMALKYAEAVLAVHFRTVDEKGRYMGGPMYYIRYGLGPNWNWLALLFASCAMIASFGIGNTVQANSLADAMGIAFGVPEIISGIIVAILVAFVLLGGVRSIAKTASVLVPIMVVSYFILAILIIINNIEYIPNVISLIIQSAFNPTATQGGVVGTTIILAMQNGIARALSSNEAGMGSAPIAHAAAQTKNPVHQGMIATLGPFIDTLIVCSLTGFVILLTQANASTLVGTAMTSAAFATSIPHGDLAISAILVLLGFSTILGWSYYGERCFAYLWGNKYIFIFRILWVIAIPLGAVINFGIIWRIVDILNALMVFPNLIALLLLSPVVLKLSREYFKQ